MMKSLQKKTLWNKKYKLKNVRFGGSIQVDRNLIASQEARLSGLNDRLVAPSVEGTAALT